MSPIILLHKAIEFPVCTLLSPCCSQLHQEEGWKSVRLLSTWVKLWTLVQEPQDFRQFVFIQPAFELHSPLFAHL